jgi:hypothetical protein
MPMSKIRLVAIPRSRHSCIRPTRVPAPHVAVQIPGARSPGLCIPLPVVEVLVIEPSAAAQAVLERERSDMASTVLELVWRM